MDPNISLREEQIARLGQYIGSKRFLDLSDPGTGKTPPVCTYIWYQWKELQRTTLWTQPKSLLGKNRRELLRWTEFEPDDVVILRRDWEPLPAGGTNLPTMEVVKQEQFTDEVVIVKPNGAPCAKGDIVPFEIVEEWNRFLPEPVAFEFNWIWEITDARGTDIEPGTCFRSVDLKAVQAALAEAKKPKLKVRRTYLTRDKVTTVIDAIAAAAINGAKALLCSFHFHREHWQRLLLNFPNMGLLAIDELHMGYGGIDSQTTQAMYGTMSRVECFIGMTGTLLNGKLDSVYPAISVIEPRYYPSGYSDFWGHHVKYEDDYGRVLEWKNVERVGQILLNHGVRRTFEEVYGKEDVVFLPADVDMNPLMREAYDEFHEAALLELSDGRFLDGSLPGVATIRARQIAAHPETFGLCRGEMTGKDEWLEIQVTDAIMRGENLLIFSVFVPEQERIVRLLEKMGRRVGLMNASTSGPKREKIDMAFTSGQLDDVVGSPQTMAVGWNWEHVDHVIPVSYNYQDVDWLQSYRRASRGTRKKTLRVTFPRYWNSVDFRVLEVIREKSILANKVDPTRPVLQLAL